LGKKLKFEYYYVIRVISSSSFPSHNLAGAAAVFDGKTKIIKSGVVRDEPPILKKKV
jgi:hypothetical protein